MKSFFLISFLFSNFAYAKFGVETLDLKHLNCSASIQYLSVVDNDSEEWQMQLAKEYVQFAFEAQNEFYNFKAHSDDYCSEQQPFGAEVGVGISEQKETDLNGERYYSIIASSYYYSGGAHGNSMRKAIVYNITQNKLITSLFAFNPDYPSEKVYDLIEAKLKEKNQYFPEFFAAQKKAVPNLKNLYPTKSGLVFFFDPYEVGPYAEGEIDVVISYEELESISIAGERDI